VGGAGAPPTATLTPSFPPLPSLRRTGRDGGPVGDDGCGAAKSNPVPGTGALHRGCDALPVAVRLQPTEPCAYRGPASRSAAGERPSIHRVPTFPSSLRDEDGLWRPGSDPGNPNGVALLTFAALAHRHCVTRPSDAKRKVLRHGFEIGSKYL